MTDHKRLRDLLIEDSGNDDDLQLIQQLRTWSPPASDQTKRHALIQSLLHELPQQHRLSWRASVMNNAPILLLRSQARIVRREIWIVSAFVMLLGLLVTLALSTTHTLAMALVAPLVAAVGISQVYGPLSDPALEIELAAPVSMRLLIIARMGLIFGFDLLLALSGSLLLAIINADLMLWDIISVWLAPMTFLSALAFLLSTLLLDSILVILLCFMLWGVFILQQLRLPFINLNALPDFTTTTAQPIILIAGVMLMLIGVWLAGRNERLVQHV